MLDSKLDVISITSGGKHAVSTVKNFNLIFDLIFIDNIFSDFDLYDKWIFSPPRGQQGLYMFKKDPVCSQKTRLYFVLLECI